MTNERLKQYRECDQIHVCIHTHVFIHNMGWEYSSSPPHPERFWGLPSLLSNG